MGLRKSVDDWMADAYMEPWAAYLEHKHELGHLERVRDVWVDVPNVVDRVFSCDPATCSPGLRKRGVESCCAEFSVEITAKERDTLQGHWSGIHAFLAARDDHFARRVDTLDDVLVPHEDNPWQPSLGKRKRRCALSFLDERGAITCGVHGYCLEEGLDVHAVKPKLCFLFPMLVQDLQDGTWLVTVLDEENSGLVGFSSHDELPCLHGEKTFGAAGEGGVPFYDDHRATLAHLFGKAFMNGLDRLASRRGKRPRGSELVPLKRGARTKGRAPAAR
jgi:hypothetical protein